MIKEISHKDFSGYLFWDVDCSKIDFIKSKAYVIERVLSHGMLTDWYKIKDYYGLDTIREVVLNLRYLDKRSLHFCSATLTSLSKNSDATLTRNPTRDTGITEIAKCRLFSIKR